MDVDNGVSKESHRPGYFGAIVIIGLFMIMTIARNATWGNDAGDLSLWDRARVMLMGGPQSAPPVTAEHYMDGKIVVDGIGTRQVPMPSAKAGTGIWQDTVMKSPMKVRARIGFAAALDREGMLDQAMEQYRAALQLSYRPDEPDAEAGREFAQMGMSDILVKTGQLDQAQELLMNAWEVDKPFPGYAVNLSAIWLKRGGAKPSLDILNEAEAHMAEYPAFREQQQLYLNRGAAYGMLGDCVKAVADFRKAQTYPDGPKNIPHCP